MNTENDRKNSPQNASGKPNDGRDSRRDEPVFADGQQSPGKASSGGQSAQQNPKPGSPQQGQNTPAQPGKQQQQQQQQTPQPGQQGQQGQQGKQGQQGQQPGQQGGGKEGQSRQQHAPGNTDQDRTPAEQGKTGPVLPTSTPAKAAKGDDDLMSKQQQQAMPSGDQIKGEWKQKVGAAKIMWGKLTDDELIKSEGHADKLAGLVQARYAVSRDEADKQIKGFFAKQKS